MLDRRAGDAGGPILFEKNFNVPLLPENGIALPRVNKTFNLLGTRICFILLGIPLIIYFPFQAFNIIVIDFDVPK